MTRELTRIGIDLGALDAKKLPDPRTPDCPGAALRITRYDFDAMVSAGELFASSRKEIPHDGYGNARVSCTNLVAQLPRTSAGHVQYYGLCSSCSASESRNREELAERARVKGER